MTDRYGMIGQKGGFMNTAVFDVLIPQLGRLGLKLLREGHIKGEVDETLLAIAEGIETIMDTIPADKFLRQNNVKG